MRRLWFRILGFFVAAVWVACGRGDAEDTDPTGSLTFGPESGGKYYIRMDGGDLDQCTGMVNAPYPGSGTSQPCAWDHPFRALPPGGSSLIGAGSTLVIGPGEYMMGYGAPGADNPNVCSSEYPWDCYVAPVPSGMDEMHPTRILGFGWDVGCTNPPKLWGTQRSAMILNLSQSSDVEIACLEITDHAGCAEDHTGGLACERHEYPYGDWASVGIFARDSARVYLRDLDIHGLAVHGLWAGRLSDWTLENVRLAGNGWAGWDADIEGDDSNSGDLIFRKWIVEWNGCVESYPDQKPQGCWSQSAGGYGDGVGTGSTSGNWIIEDSAFLYNTSDGLDLLYHDQGGSITLRRVRAEGNAGNPVKITGQGYIENSVMIANCGFFDGKPFTYQVDPCRALGNALELSFTGGETVHLINNTIYGHGDGLVGAGPREGFNCDGGERIFGRNNLYLGGGDYFNPEDQSFLFYYENCAGLSFNSNYNLYYDVKLSKYSPEHNDINLDPQLVGPLSGVFWNMKLRAESPAIDNGDSKSCPAHDHDGFIRPIDGNGDGDLACDIGAFEWNKEGVRIFLPFLADEMAHDLDTLID